MDHMAENQRRCPFCNASVKDRAFRCRTCGSIIGKKCKVIPSTSEGKPDELECSPAVVTLFRDKEGITMTAGGLFLFGIMVLVPVAGQIACLVTGLVLLFNKKPQTKKKGKIYLLYSFLFFVLWFAALYVLNMTFQWVSL